MTSIISMSLVDIFEPHNLSNVNTSCLIYWYINIQCVCMNLYKKNPAISAVARTMCRIHWMRVYLCLSLWEVCFGMDFQHIFAPCIIIFYMRSIYHQKRARKKVYFPIDTHFPNTKWMRGIWEEWKKMKTWIPQYWLNASFSSNCDNSGDRG